MGGVRPVANFVRWVDSASIGEGRWLRRDEIDPSSLTANGLEQATIGFVIDESDEVLLLAQSYSVVDPMVGAALAIPKAAIIERRAATPPDETAAYDLDRELFVDRCACGHDPMIPSGAHHEGCATSGSDS